METLMWPVACPYCGEQFDVQVDPSAGSQTYVEDCYVCCQPMVLQVSIGFEGAVEDVWTRQENE